MRNSHAFLHRADVRAGLLALALGCVSLTLEAAPVNSGNIGRMGVSGNARTTALTPGAPPTNSGGSTIPISPQSGGWTRAGNYGVPPSATGPNAGTITGNGDVVFRDSYKNGQNSWDVNGVKYPAQTSTPIPWGTVGGVAAGVVCVVSSAGVCAIAGGVAAAAPYIIDWLGRANMRRDPATGEVQGLPDNSEGLYCWPGPCYWWQYRSKNYPTQEAACRAYADYQNGLNNGRVTIAHASTNGSTSTCYVRETLSNGSVSLDGNYGVGVGRVGSRDPDSPNWTPLSVASIAARLAPVLPDPRVWGEVIDKGGTVDLPNPTVTGPTSIQGPETVKQNSDGTREVSRTTYNFTTNGNTITNTTNVTTTNTYNSSNVQTNSTTTTTTPSENTPQPEPTDPCQKNPTALGCRDIDFDTPDGKVPKESKDVSFQAENVLGSGSCPADVYASVTTLHATLKVWDWQATCNYFLPIRFILMALAAFSAVLIILPGGKSA